MKDPDLEKLHALLKQEIHSETAKVAWIELQRFFAAGKAIHVSPDLDLVETALQISTDNSTLIKQWMAKGQLAPVSDAQARCWVDTDATVWAVVVKPWVLVQAFKEQGCGQ
ncbi:MAG: DUF2288 domain-containing protein [Gammaproteobacteria bacterium]|nr:DUF2288 domain-containing protein [Gammaproteobacteria bacterium]